MTVSPAGVRGIADHVCARPVVRDASDRRDFGMVIGARRALRRGGAACLSHARLSRRQALPVARRDPAEVMSALSPAGLTKGWISGLASSASSRTV
jgi:hypothetical protein